MKVPFQNGVSGRMSVPPEKRFPINKFGRFCEDREIPVYIPLQGRSAFYGNRRKISWVPLFPGYAFCVVGNGCRTLVKQNQYVANLLAVGEQAKLINQLVEIRRALSAGRNLEVMSYIEEGRLARVKRGALKGMEGIVQRIKGRTRVVLSLDIIRASVCVEVESADLVMI